MSEHYPPPLPNPGNLTLFPVAASFCRRGCRKNTNKMQDITES